MDAAAMLNDSGDAGEVSRDGASLDGTGPPLDASDGSPGLDGDAHPSDAEPGSIAPCATISSSGKVLFDTGHAAQIMLLRKSGDRMVSQDITGHWILWDVPRRAQIATGENPACPLSCSPTVDLAGSTLSVHVSSAIELRAAADGQVLGTVPTPSGGFGLASDGSYLFTASANGLTAFSSSGQPLVNRSGNYANANVAAVPGELRVALGAAGSTMVELVPIAGGSSVTHVFAGTFHSWFLDGGRFLATTGSTVRVYSKDAVQQQILTLSTLNHLTGQGNYFWTFDNNAPGGPLNIYAVGTDTPVATSIEGAQTAVIGSQSALVLAPGAGSFDVVDLSGPTVARTHYDVPVSYLEAFAVDPLGSWAVGNRNGVIFESSGFGAPGGPFSLGCGEVWSIAGSASGRAAVATASGQILHFSFGPNERSLSGVVPFASGKVALSSDGTLLIAEEGQFGDPYRRSLEVFALPGGGNVKTWTYSNTAYPPFHDFAVSRDLSRVAQLTCTDFLTCTRIVNDFGGTTYFTDAYPDPGHNGPDLTGICLSIAPNDSLIAVTDTGLPSTASATRIYDGMKLIGATNGYLVGWIDDQRLLVQNYSSTGGAPVYSSSTIVDPQGNVVATPALPAPIGRIDSFSFTSTFEILGPSEIYSDRQNTIYSLSDGSVVWTSPDSQGGHGAVAGGYVVFAQGHQVFAETH